MTTRPAPGTRTADLGTGSDQPVPFTLTPRLTRCWTRYRKASGPALLRGRLVRRPAR